MNTLDLIAKRLAAPKNFRVTTHYADGAAKTHDTETEGQANNWAAGESRKIGRSLVNRETGETVEIVSVEVTAL